MSSLAFPSPLSNRVARRQAPYRTLALILPLLATACGDFKEELSARNRNPPQGSSNYGSVKESLDLCDGNEGLCRIARSLPHPENATARDAAALPSAIVPLSPPADPSGAQPPTPERREIDQHRVPAGPLSAPSQLTAEQPPDRPAPELSPARIVPAEEAVEVEP